MRESGVLQRNVQDGHHNDLDSHEGLDGQGGQGSQRLEKGHLKRCIHDFPGGKGCYVCDLQHPYRLQSEAVT